MAYATGRIGTNGTFLAQRTSVYLLSPAGLR